MAKINHPTQSRGQDISRHEEPKLYTVEDESGPQKETESQQENNIFDVVSQKPPKDPAPKNKMDEVISRSLEQFIFMGRKTKEVKIEDHVFELCSLSNKETAELFERVMAEENSNLFTVRNITLAMSIKKIDGKKISELMPELGDLKDYDKLMLILVNLQYACVDTLYEEYEKMTTDTEKESDEKNIKN